MGLLNGLPTELQRHKLLNRQANLAAAGHVRPETLLFSAFGFPNLIRLDPESVLS
jgi:hypothetical protein